MGDVLAIARRQHGLITRAQLISLGLSRRAIDHRLSRGRLHRVRAGVYAVGSPLITRHAGWSAAILACGRGAVLSHGSAAALWGIRQPQAGPIHVSKPRGPYVRQNGVIVHRRERLETSQVTKHNGIPVTNPILTLIDIAADLGRIDLERAINEADKLGLVDPETLRRRLTDYPRMPGTARVRRTLDHHTFTQTDSWLAQRFVPIALRAGLPKPITGEWLNGYEVDFWWPELGLVVETDGLTYHRTPATQTADRRRDQAHTAAGLTQLRFTRAQVRYQPNYVEDILRKVASRLRRDVQDRSLPRRTGGSAQHVKCSAAAVRRSSDSP